MNPENILDYPIFRMVWFLAFVGIFFYSDYPKNTWKWYFGLPVYWLFIAFFYFGISGMMSAGMLTLFGPDDENSASNSALADQITITSLGLLFLYRLFSRYKSADESTIWATDFIMGIVMTYVGINALFYGFSDYLVNGRKLEEFSGTTIAFVWLAIFFVLDFLFWLKSRRP